MLWLPLFFNVYAILQIKLYYHNIVVDVDTLQIQSSQFLCSYAFGLKREGMNVIIISLPDARRLVLPWTECSANNVLPILLINQLTYFASYQYNFQIVRIVATSKQKHLRFSKGCYDKNTHLSTIYTIYFNSMENFFNYNFYTIVFINSFCRKTSKEPVNSTLHPGSLATYVYVFVINTYEMQDSVWTRV